MAAHINRFFRNARPDPLFKYFSKAIAVYLSVNDK